MNEDAAVDWLLSPESPEPETDTDEAPQEETEAEEVEAKGDEPDEAENTDEEEAEGEDAEADSEEDEDDDQEDTDDDPDAWTFTTASGQQVTLSEGDYLDLPDNTPIRYKVDGEWVTGTLGERRREESGQAYIQQGMEKAKQFEKQLIEQSQAMQQERQLLAQMYQQAQQTGFKPAPEPPARELLDQDLYAYMEADAQYREDLQAYQQQQRQMQYLQQREEEHLYQQEQKHLASEMERLTQLVPEFGDAKKAPELREKLTKSAAEYYEYTPEEVNQVNDARAIAVLKDAIAYRELKAGKQAAKQPREKAKAVTKPSGKRRDGGKRAQAQKQLQKARQTQSDDDWVNVLLTP
ncbi:hypothetical protein PVV74_17375 [Roseovarius sp. SK2]|uniref:hypothetical protein n=1 Tax=Roseovarius TaxID=74030 RepID=UPI00237B0E05|nr:hypothetical protein [Roseovarius sp. SK2]MDD9727235.1 hypothetical protein [Roseovarius sp. SK2]